MLMLESSLAGDDTTLSGEICQSPHKTKKHLADLPNCCQLEETLRQTRARAAESALLLLLLLLEYYALRWCLWVAGVGGQGLHTVDYCTDY